MKLQEQHILVKGFQKTKTHMGYSTYRLPIADVCYYICFIEWRGDYGLYIEYTDSPNPKDEGELYSFGVVSTVEEWEAFFKIMSYKEYYNNN